MKILVTGGLGYLGSAVVPALCAAFPSAKILVLDDLSLGRRETLQTFPSGRTRLIRGDIRTFDFSKLRLGSSDFVIHLAALSRPEESFHRKKDFEAVNFSGALRTARFCAQSGTAFFFPSTVSVFSAHGGKTIQKPERFLKPQTPYARLKLRVERELNKIKKLRFSTARLGTVYGWAPGISYSTAVNKFCLQASKGEALSIWKTAWKQYRPYLAVEDAARLIVHLIRKNEFNSKIYLAASDHARVQDVAREIKRYYSGMRVLKVHSKSMNRLSYKVSDTRLAALGFRTKGSLASEIRKLARILKQKST